MREIRNTVTGIAALVAPTLLLASTVAYIANDAGLSEGEAAGAIQVWAFIAFGVAIVGLARLLDETAPRAAAAVTVAGVIGCAGGVAYGIDAIQLAVLDGSIHDSPASPIALRLPGLVFPVAVVALGVLLARHHVVKAPIGYLMAVAAVLFPASRIPDIAALAVASDVIMLAALGSVGFTLLTGATGGVRLAAS